MVTRKEDTPQRVANRKYEEKNREKRQAASGNFQTMIPRELFDEINAFLKERNMSKVDFIKTAYELIKITNDSQKVSKNFLRRGAATAQCRLPLRTA